DEVISEKEKRPSDEKQPAKDERSSEEETRPFLSQANEEREGKRDEVVLDEEAASKKDARVREISFALPPQGEVEAGHRNRVAQELRIVHADVMRGVCDEEPTQEDGYEKRFATRRID